MDHLWSPWRYHYIRQAAPGGGDCLFCRVSAEKQDKHNLVVLRGKWNFVMLNRYPYNNGHLMIAPYRHTGVFTELTAEELHEMIELVQRFVRILGGVYRPQGFNLGMNLGECAGAGIAQHLHMHVLPRWLGDANFMTTVGETRVHPQSLEDAYEGLCAALEAEKQEKSAP